METSATIATAIPAVSSPQPPAPMPRTRGHPDAAGRAAQEGGLGAKSGAVTAVQRTSSDLRLNPHLHMIALDGTWCEKDGELAWEGLGHLRTSEVGEVLERLVRRMERHLRRSGLLRTFEDEA